VGGSSATWDLRAPLTAWGGGWGRADGEEGAMGWNLGHLPSTAWALMATSDDGDRRAEG
jgi:hypothetical protein